MGATGKSFGVTIADVKEALLAYQHPTRMFLPKDLRSCGTLPFSQSDLMDMLEDEKKLQRFVDPPSVHSSPDDGLYLMDESAKGEASYCLYNRERGALSELARFDNLKEAVAEKIKVTMAMAGVDFGN